MPFPLPTPTELTRRLESRMELALRAARPDASPAAIARAVRSPRGILAAIVRVTAMALYEAHLHLRWWGNQYFPDSAEVENLERHASIWGVVRRAATRAVGQATVQGAVGTTIPAGSVLIGATSDYTVDEAVTITVDDADGEVTISITANEAGPDGNLAIEGTPLTFETPIAGLAEPVAYVGAEGILGGAAIESDASLLSRLLELIRDPAHGGAAFDYPRWVQNSFAAVQVKSLPNWVGEGSVGVVVAMGTALLPRAPTETELDDIAAYLETVRPVTAEVIMVPVELLAVDLTILVDPYTAAVRAAVEAAIKAFFAAEAKIGTRLPKSRLSEAISAAAGEYRHELSVPAADILPSASQLPVPGTITWVAPT